jgi:Trk-type K+ transport system membrane component
MNPLTIIKTLAFLMLIISGFMLVPAGIALYLSETTELFAFLAVVMPLLFLSGTLLYALRNRKAEALSTRDAFLFVTGSWITASLAGALPFFISGAIPSFTGRLFRNHFRIHNHRRLNPDRYRGPAALHTLLALSDSLAGRNGHCGTRSRRPADDGYRRSPAQSTPNLPADG